MTEEREDETGPDAGAGGEGAVEESEFEDAVSELDRVESRRRRLGVILGVGAVLALGAAIILVAEFRDFVFQPKMPIEKSHRKIVRKTDDPQCRQLIADVTDIGNQYYALEAGLEKHVPGGDHEAIRNVDRKLATLGERLDAAQELSKKANLRFEKSRKELKKWFSYVDNEIWVLRDVIDGELPGGADRAASSDAGDIGVDTGDVSAGPRESGGGDQGRSPTERRDGAMVALHDAFENFRVWHSANLHPCGNAGEGETPWRPDDWEADAGTTAAGD